MAISFQPTIFSGFKQMQSDTVDSVLNQCKLEHTWRWLSDRAYPASFWSPQFFFPTPYTLTYSENMVGVAPFYWGLRLVFSDELAWQWFVLLISGLNYFAMVIVLRWFGVNPLLATLGGFLFAFGLPRQDHLCQQDLFPQAFAPFAVWYVWKFLHEPDRRSWALALVFTAWQLLASIQHGWFLMFSLGIWLLFICCFDWGTIRNCSGFVGENRWFFLATSLIWLAGMWLFFRNYFIGNATMRRDYVECLYIMPRPSTWLACPAHSLWELRLAPAEEAHGQGRHYGMGLGYLFILLIGLLTGWEKRRDPVWRPWALFALTSLLTCLVLVFITTNLGDGESLWYPFYQIVPGAKSIRCVGRVGFTVMLLSLIGSLTILQRSLSISVASPKTCCAISLLLLLICAGEQVCVSQESFARSEFYPKAAELAKQIAGADAVYVLPDPQSREQPGTHDLIAMWAGLHSNVPVVNGNSGRSPDNYVDPSKNLEAEVMRVLGQKWQGQLLIVELGNPLRKRRFDIRLDANGSQVMHRIEEKDIE